MYIPRSGSEVTNGGVSGVMRSNLGKVMEGKGRSESSENARSPRRMRGEHRRMLNGCYSVQVITVFSP